MTDCQENYWNLLEHIWNEQPYADGPEFTDWFNRLTIPQQVLFPTHWLCSEVRNGGFHQYFTNSTGYHAPEAVQGFVELGLGDIASIVQRAIAVFGESFPRERLIREQFLASFEGNDRSEWDPFYKLDDLFYESIKIPGAPKFHAEDRFSIAANRYAIDSANK